MRSLCWVRQRPLPTYTVRIAAEVKNWSIAEVGEDPLRWRHHPRQTLFAVASGIQAIRTAGLNAQ